MTNEKLKAERERQRYLAERARRIRQNRIDIAQRVIGDILFLGIAYVNLVLIMAL